MKMWCLSVYPQGMQDVSDFVSSVEYKQRFLTQSVAVCQSYNGSQWDSRLWETKNIHRQNQNKPPARDDTSRSKDTKRLVCARNWAVFISFFLPLIPRMIQLSWARSHNCWCMTRRLLALRRIADRHVSLKWTLLIETVDRVNGLFEWRGKNFFTPLSSKSQY